MKWFFIFLFFTGCTASKNRTNIEWVRNMMKQPSVKAQERSEGDSKKKLKPIGTLIPPEGTKSINKNYYPYIENLEGAIKNLKNPYKNSYKNQFNQELLLMGKRSYQKACIYCHGKIGDGEGAMKNLMIVRPPSLLSKKVRKMPDAHMYHIIHEGQGLMGSYRLQVRTDKERWALIYYIRNLQRASSAL